MSDCARTLQKRSRAPVALCMIWLGTAGACSPSRVEPPPAIVPAPSLAPSRDTTAPPAHTWRPRYAPAQLVYRIRERAEIATDPDTSARRIALDRTFLLRLSTAKSGHLLVLSAAIDSGADTTSPPPMATLEVTELGAQPLSATMVSTPDCAHSPAPSSLGGTINSLITPFPATLMAGVEWMDTTHLVSCRRGVPISIATVRSYRLDSAGASKQHAALYVQRSDTITAGIAGEADSTLQLRIQGHGSASGTAVLDPAAGLPYDVTDTSLVTFDIATRSGTSRFQQRVVRQIERVSPR